MAKVPCGEPVALAIKEHEVAGHGGKRHGVKMAIGRPAQDVVFQLHSGFAVVAASRAPIDKSNCEEDKSTRQCLFIKGGVFDKKKSSTWKDATMEDYGGDNQHKAESYGKDWLNMGPYDEQPEFPFVLDNGFNNVFVWDHVPILGLSRHSNIVNRLFIMTSIPSQLWSIQWGKNGNNKVDGELLFGGYNKKRLKGEFRDVMKEYSFVNKHCAYELDVVRITAKFPDGTSVRLMDEKKTHCIHTLYPMLTMPRPYVEKLNEKLGGAMDLENGSNMAKGAFYERGYAIPKDKNFKGDLEYEFASGQKVLITNDVLVADYKDIDKNGDPKVVDNDKSVLMIHDLAGHLANDTPLLGAPFLSQVYMTVDMNREKFFLGPAAYPRAGDNDYAIVEGTKVLQCDPKLKKIEDGGSNPSPQPQPTQKEENEKPEPSRGGNGNGSDNGESDDDDDSNGGGNSNGGGSPRPSNKPNNSNDNSDDDDDSSNGGSNGGSGGNSNGGSRPSWGDPSRSSEIEWVGNNGNNVNMGGNSNNNVNGNNPNGNGNGNGNNNNSPVNSQTPPSPGQPNTGAIIGGAVGASVAILLIGALLFLFMRRRKDRMRHSITNSEFSSFTGMTKFPPSTVDPRSAYQSGYYDPSPLQKHEITNGQGSYELGDAPAPQELALTPPTVPVAYAHGHGQQVHEADSREVYTPRKDQYYNYEGSLARTPTAYERQGGQRGYDAPLPPSPPINATEGSALVPSEENTRNSRITRKPVQISGYGYSGGESPGLGYGRG